MRPLLCLIVMILLHSVCSAGDPDSGYGTCIAVEFRVNNKFTASVGKLEYTGQSIDIVSFTKGIFVPGIVTLPQVYLITEKTIRMKGVHHFKGINQYGVVATGHIDFRDQINPQITMLADNGGFITNISAEGKDWFKKHIPYIMLGQGADIP